ncbi:hypothetical protein OS493_024440 [Desmophyllum pertusum]|uniref:Uncharacterized protein n=1 Tax=Desmophyllum pertusum TaxID=174260 RepID=A0A9W9YBU5_9CNID|nr:hypothetical protein OS493_024440 [Desmophyllum pertusum]
MVYIVVNCDDSNKVIEENHVVGREQELKEGAKVRVTVPSKIAKESDSSYNGVVLAVFGPKSKAEDHEQSLSLITPSCTDKQPCSCTRKRKDDGKENKENEVYQNQKENQDE